jgi:hypothetical protein
VNRYVQHQSTPELQELARQRLALLIRVPHLSNRWLLELLTARAPQHLVLHSLWEPIRMLVNLRELQRGKRWQIAGAPPSWQLGPRAATDQVLAVECTGRFSVSVIKQASCRAFEQQDAFDALPITDMHAPLAGAAFRAYLGFVAGEAGTTLGFFVQQPPSSPEAGTQVFIEIDFTLTLGAVSRSGSKLSCSSEMLHPRHNPHFVAGFRDFLDIGPMAGGWDELAWANKGLPTAGEVDIRMKLSLPAPPAGNQQQPPAGNQQQHPAGNPQQPPAANPQQLPAGNPQQRPWPPVGNHWPPARRPWPPALNPRRAAGHQQQPPAANQQQQPAGNPQARPAGNQQQPPAGN